MAGAPLTARRNNDSIRIARLDMGEARTFVLVSKETVSILHVVAGEKYIGMAGRLCDGSRCRVRGTIDDMYSIEEVLTEAKWTVELERRRSVTRYPVPETFQRAAPAVPPVLERAESSGSLGFTFNTVGASSLSTPGRLDDTNGATPATRTTTGGASYYPAGGAGEGTPSPSSPPISQH